MSRVYVFADESGNFDFRRRTSATKYYILGTVTTHDPAIGEHLLRLRRSLAWDGLALDSEFHASEDKQLIRNAVFDVLETMDFRVDATIIEKSKTQPHISRNHVRFYKQLWFFHFKYLSPKIVTTGDQLMVTASKIGTKRQRTAFRAALEDVVFQTSGCDEWKMAFWQNHSDPCLQIADYCTWAIQRKWEQGDSRAFDRIAPKVSSQFDVFARGSKHYY